MRAGIAGFVDRQTRRPAGQRVRPEDDLEVKNLWRRVGDFQRLLQRLEARGKSSGDWISGFWSREILEHIYGVGFIRQSLELRRSDKLSHGFA